MSQKYLQILALSAIIGSLGSSGMVQAVPCESFVGEQTKIMQCFIHSDDCYMEATGKCHTKDPAPCEHEKRQSPKECDRSDYSNKVYKYHNCHWGTIPIKIGEKDVKIGERDVVVGKDKKGNNIMGKQDIMGKEDIMGTKPACVKG